jgi:3-hydroxyacyl-[acyl-carrier-protein] dehydratase
MKPPLLPHGPGFRLLDAVSEVQPGPSLTARVWLNPSWPVFADHFPANPLLPAVYMMEMAAQAGGALWAAHAGFPPKEPLHLVELRQFRVRQSARPGDNLTILVKLETDWKKLALFSAVIECNENAIAEGTLVLAAVTPVNPG